MSKPVLTLEAQGGPAFPLHMDTMSDCEGMTLRDWFAGQALARSLSDGIYADSIGMKGVADAAYEMADAMLASRLRAVSQP